MMKMDHLSAPSPVAMYLTRSVVGAGQKLSWGHDEDIDEEKTFIDKWSKSETSERVIKKALFIKFHDALEEVHISGPSLYPW